MSGKHTQNGQYGTWTGSKYDGDRHPNETAKLIRAEVREAVKSGRLPAGPKYRVTRGHGWGSFDLAINVPDPDGWAFGEGRRNASWESGHLERPQWTPEAMVAGFVLHEIGESYVKHTSDVMTDYWSGGHLFVYLSTSSAHGGLCLPRFSEGDAYPRWRVQRSMFNTAVRWAAFSTRSSDADRWFDTWQEAIDYAAEQAAGRKVA